ncbi:MAG TPA: redox-sensing transcriptional repressor Rex [Verrucomicrobiota bacterium]|nr:redox-sensing transcriptional repressor Rex [Verrucomicrobiota bacterium]
MTCSMTAQAAKPVPEPTLKRLPLYHRLLKELLAAGRPTVSCTEIGAGLALDPTQVRKDLETAGVAGRPRIGYAVTDVVDQLEQFLGWKKVNEAFLVGAGSLGSALLGYRKFEECGLKIVAAFDADPARVGRRIHGTHVLALPKLPGLARRMHVLIGIITVPAEAAQGVADLLVEGGIRAIWNFAPVRLHLPEGIIVHNEDLYCSLAALSQKLAAALAAEPARRSRTQAATPAA